MSMLDDFISLSKFLLGIPFQPPLPPITDLDEDLGNVYLTQLNQWSPQASSMNSLLTTWEGIQQLPPNQQTAAVQTQIMNDPNLGQLARQIILAWYTGFHPWFPGQRRPLPIPRTTSRRWFGSLRRRILWACPCHSDIGNIRRTARPEQATTGANMSEPLDCDVVIVGAGIAGALVAWKLGSQGVKVIVLESGPGNQNLAQRQSYVDQFKISGAPYPLRPAALKN